MIKRLCMIAALAAAAVVLLPGRSVACGDKFVLIGGGGRVMRSKFPSRILVFMTPASRVAEAEKEFHVEATLTAAGHKATVVETPGEVDKAIASGKYDLVLADTKDVPQLRQRCNSSPSKPAIVPLLYKPTADELAAAEKEASCAVKPSKKPTDLLAVVDETMKERTKGTAPNCPPIQ